MIDGEDKKRGGKREPMKVLFSTESEKHRFEIGADGRQFILHVIKKHTKTQYAESKYYHKLSDVIDKLATQKGLDEADTLANLIRIHKETVEQLTREVRIAC